MAHGNLVCKNDTCIFRDPSITTLLPAVAPAHAIMQPDRLSRLRRTSSYTSSTRTSDVEFQHGKENYPQQQQQQQQHRQRQETATNKQPTLKWVIVTNALARGGLRGYRTVFWCVVSGHYRTPTSTSAGLVTFAGEARRGGCSSPLPYWTCA